jgi:hypothetical protein
VLAVGEGSVGVGVGDCGGLVDGLCDGEETDFEGCGDGDVLGVVFGFGELLTVGLGAGAVPLVLLMPDVGCKCFPLPVTPPGEC